MMDQDKWDRNKARWQQKAQRVEQRIYHRHHHGFGFGMLVLLVGVILLLKQLNFPISGWIFTWPMLLVAIGLLTFSGSGFRNTGSLILVLIGGFFLARDYWGISNHIVRMIPPLGIILVGLVIIMRPRRRHYLGFWSDWNEGLPGASGTSIPGKGGPVPGNPSEQGSGGTFAAGDRLECTAVFCSLKRNVISKNFSGGELVNVFGGTCVDLSQADFQGTSIVELNILFGAVKLILPANWEVRTNIIHVFSGIEDKRNPQGIIPDSNKVLKLTGTVVFGGVELVSY